MLSKSARGKGPPEAPRDGFCLSVSGTTGKPNHAFLRRHLIAAEKLVPSAPRLLSVALVGDAVMSRLHEEFLGIPGPTDVLTFEIDHDGRGRPVAGEVVVCVPEARRQAQQRGSAVRLELLLYALHGMLHLSGFDDRTDAGYRNMHRKEDEILARLGVGRVFAASPGRRSGRGSKDR